jgi:hypothetical protein
MARYAAIQLQGDMIMLADGQQSRQERRDHMKKTLSLSLAVLAVATTFAVADAEAHRWNPPGPRGGPGTNWHNPPGPRGGPGASPHRWWMGNPPGPVGGPGAGPRWHHRHVPHGWVYWGYHGPFHWYWHPRGYWCRFDNDGNPPGPAGGPGTNWENPPGPIGGPGASPDSRYRPC